MSGEVDSQMTFYFGKIQNTSVSEQAIVHVSLDDETNTVRVVVDLNSLPYSEFYGYEVVSKFMIHGFENNQTFWTDSNGLEMQKRILNYRPTWNLTGTNYNQSLENVTANFFPINSAMSMVDNKGVRKFTVMNDRSQAGTALQAGTFEFM